MNFRAGTCASNYGNRDQYIYDNSYDLVLTISLSSSSERFLVSGTYIQTNTAAKRQDGNQIYPYCGLCSQLVIMNTNDVVILTYPQFRALGLIKYGAVNAASHCNSQ